MKKKLLYSPLSLLVMAYLVLCISSCGRQASNIRLSDLTVETLAGENVDLKSYVGKPLVISIWATWCPPCNRELPIFDKLAKELTDKVTFLLISDETPEKLTKFAEKHTEFQHFTFLKNTKANKEYTNAIPTTYFFDISGNLIDKYIGEMTEEELRNYINASLVYRPSTPQP